MSLVWPKTEYEQVVQLISTRVGLQFNDHRHKTLQTALDQLLVSGELANLPDLLARLETSENSDSLWQQIIQALTVGETYFYRNQAHVNALYQHVLPTLIEARRKAGCRQLRIWSAGCATGEEPYTLAMILHDLIPDIDNWSISLLATDVNLDYLKRARAGYYRTHSFRGETPDWVQKRWFTPQDGGFLLKPAIRRMVTFAPLNLISDVYPSAANNTLSMDLVVCRNVTIYFSREQTQQVINRFYDTLVDGGWLIVGHSEPQPGVYQQYVMHNHDNAILYQKVVQTAESRQPASVEPAKRKSLPAVTVNVAGPADIVEAAQRRTQADHTELWRRAQIAANREDWGEAFQLLDEIESADVLQPQIHYLRALIQLQMGDRAASLVSLRQAVYCDPSFALAHYTLGELHEKAGALDEAARYWRRAQKSLAQLDPQQPLPFAEDMTVEMLKGLLDYRLMKHQTGV